MDSDVVVVGGRGGTRARLDDLERASRVLRLASHCLVEVGLTARRASHVLERHSISLPTRCTAVEPQAAALHHAAVERLTWIDVGPGGATATSDLVERLARDLVETVKGLEDAERVTASRWAWLHRTWDKVWAVGEIAVWVPLKVVGASSGWAIDRVKQIPIAGTILSPVLAPAGWTADTINPDWTPNPGPLLYGDDLQILLRLVDVPVRALLWIPRSLVVAAGGDMPDGIVELLSADLALLTLALDSILGEPHGPVAVPVSSRRVDPPDDLAGLFTRLDSLSPSGADGPGSIAIERVEHDDGTAAWIVEIPGTQDWSPNGTLNHFDLTSNGQLMATGVSDVTLGVEEAMRVAGIPADEPVMLVGHSQGGIAAVALASSPAFLGRYRVSAVATAGAPVARFAPGDRVHVLSLEHTSDTVPALDGAHNPDRVNWTTVRRDLSQSSDPTERAADHGILGRHDLDSYVATADRVDRSSDPSIRAWKDVVSPFVADHDATSVRTVYDLAGGTRRLEVASRLPSRDLAKPFPREVR